ncbi:GMC family oxidoreductase [Benzoatithermus flavus]|uniref:GMC family oxidoreductase N-terminal domain-containing protein n=1 Tax=Benzoatithermus flavus TaxID=3108223 RepID=A0ABU8XVX7_9PROT
MGEFDYIIVGAGSAGCVLAERLSADRSKRVLLLEAGGSDRRFRIRMPIGYGRTFHDPAVNWRYTTEPDPGLGGRAAYWPRGKVVGGSSSINAMVYCRGLPGDYDDWRDAGNPGWGWTDVEPVFRSFERRIRRDGSQHGDGPLWVSDREPEYHPIKRHFYAAARELGLPVVDDLDGSAPEGGIGAYAVNTRKGLRCSAADAFLRPALARSNLVLAIHARVERVAIRGCRAVGVDYVQGGRRRQATARGEVVLCAGAVNTPQLLQLSGIGPGDLLQRLGIPVVHANAAVGGGLQDHLGISYFYRATEPTLNQVLGTWPGRLAAGLRYLLTRSGPLSLGVNQLGGLVRTSPGASRPNTQLYFNPVSYSIEHAGKRPLLKPDPYPGFIIGFNTCRPTSVGRIDIASPEPERPPRITPNYLSTDRDIEDVIASARLIGRIQETEAMRALVADRPVFDPARASDEEILADFRARSGSVFHACGTCRMAPESAGGVVDGELRVHGIRALRVVDASVFPNITSANTHAPTLMVAHKAARLIAAG